MKEYKVHEYAEIFPPMNSKEFNELKRDIKENGLLDPIILYDGKILDGRNRYNACKEVGIEVKTKDYDGDNPLQYVMSTNLKRRHLTDSQKAIVGTRYKIHYAKLYPQGRNQYSEDMELVPSASARDRAGDLVGVSGRYIDIAEEVLKAKPEMEEKIMSGDIKLKQVYRDIKLEQQEKEIIALKGLKGEYEVIVIDPPWKYEDVEYDNENYMGRIVVPYPTMTIPEIRNIKLPTAKNCVLWLWTTHRFIWDAIDILKNWGFEYKAILVWDKEKLGIGKTLRIQCEFCLLGFKGNPLWKMTNERDIIREAKTNHSAKPEAFYTLVNKLCVGRKLDYFARKKREGWDVYGDEVK
jgi:N6-adenosine-specific RNA methylase IME4